MMMIVKAVVRAVGLAVVTFVINDVWTQDNLSLAEYALGRDGRKNGNFCYVFLIG